MPNPRITAKDRALLKAALRRVFSRSDFRREILDAGIVAHSDPKRKRVKTWVTCQECKQPDARSNIQIDHKQPLVPVTTTFEAMTETLDELADLVWCEASNLQRLCKRCHKVKTSLENKQRRANKASRKLQRVS